MFNKLCATFDEAVNEALSAHSRLDNQLRSATLPHVSEVETEEGTQYYAGAESPRVVTSGWWVRKRGESWQAEPV